MTSTSQPCPNSLSQLIGFLQWHKAPRRACEFAVLANFKPSHLRPSLLCAIIAWSVNDPDNQRSLYITDYGGEHQAQPIALYEGLGGSALSDEYGTNSAALQTFEMEDVAVRTGRQGLARIVRAEPSGGLEFRVRSYALSNPKPTTTKFVVSMPDEWREAEIYDTCTIFGRVLIRQYDESSASEFSADPPCPSLALLDFI